MATNGQFSWPSVGSSVAAYGQLVTATDKRPREPKHQTGGTANDSVDSSCLGFSGGTLYGTVAGHPSTLLRVR
jgi:hypothetical protein